MSKEIHINILEKLKEFCDLYSDVVDGNFDNPAYAKITIIDPINNNNVFGENYQCSFLVRPWRGRTGIVVNINNDAAFVLPVDSPSDCYILLDNLIKVDFSISTI